MVTFLHRSQSCAIHVKNSKSGVFCNTLVFIVISFKNLKYAFVELLYVFRYLRVISQKKKIVVFAPHNEKHFNHKVITMAQVLFRKRYRAMIFNLLANF